MAKGFENKTYIVCEDKGVGNVQVTEEVVCVIAGLAATEVEGVESMVGNITNELVNKLGMKNLSKGVKVDISNGAVKVYVSVILKYGYAVPEVSANVQERIANAIENMTGLKVSDVNVKIAGIKVEK